MNLGDDAKYYFDKYNKIVLNKNWYNKIYSKALNKSSVQAEMFIDNKKYKILRANYLTIINEESKTTELSYAPCDIYFKGKEKKEKLSIYSLEQYQKALNFFQIKFPYSKDLTLSNYNIITTIYGSDKKKQIEIENIDVFEKDFSNEEKNSKKLKSLSEYISLYLKTSFDFSQYPENKFLNTDDFILNEDDTFDFYMEKERTQQFMSFATLCQKCKEYFITGNVSIGKTFALLNLANLEIYNTRKAYFNLEVLQKSPEFFKIIAYEARRLFKNKEDWKSSFHKIVEKDLKSPLAMILNIIEDINSKNEADIKYIFIIDQIKFDDIDHDRSFEEMNNIRNYIKSSSNCSLLGCLSINYKGIKQILFYNWFKIKNFEKNLDIPPVELIKFIDKDFDNNNYLKILGNLPIYKNVKEKLNIKAR